MSRIYDAIKNAEELKSKTGLAGGDVLGTMELVDRRASPRQEMDIDLTVYGRDSTETPFYEQAKAVIGNAKGGLILLPVPVAEGQDLLLINNQTSQEQICRVVHLHIKDEQTSEVGIAFPVSNLEFWQVPAAKGNE